MFIFHAMRDAVSAWGKKGKPNLCAHHDAKGEDTEKQSFVRVRSGRFDGGVLTVRGPKFNR